MHPLTRTVNSLTMFTNCFKIPLMLPYGRTINLHLSLKLQLRREWSYRSLLSRRVLKIQQPSSWAHCCTNRWNKAGPRSDASSRNWGSRGSTKSVTFLSDIRKQDWHTTLLGVLLSDILTPENLAPVFASPELVRSIFPHLPPDLPTPPSAEVLQRIIDSPQFHSAVRSLDQALSTGLLGGLVRSLGLPEEAGTGVEAFLRAIRDQAAGGSGDNNTMETDWSFQSTFINK